MRERDLPADDSDRQVARLYAWQIFNLEKELEEGPDTEGVKICPGMRQVFDICYGFGWPTTRLSGDPLFPEWKKTTARAPAARAPAPRALKSCFKTGPKEVSVEWERPL